MFVGLLRLHLHIPEARSLKDRRGAVRRVIDRVRARFNVGVAEVGEANRWQVATVAVVAVSSDHATVNELLDHVASTAASAGAALVTERELTIQSYADGEPLDPRRFMQPVQTARSVESDDDDDAQQE